MSADDPVVFTYRRQSRRTWLGVVLVPIGLVVWIAVTHTVTAIVLGTLGILCFAWGGIAMLRGFGPGSFRELVIGREGVRTSMWSIRWAGIDGVSVEQRPYIGDTLVIEPVHREDIEDAPARGVFALHSRINDLHRSPRLSIPQLALEQPLDDVLEAMEEKSGRSFGRATLP